MFHFGSDRILTMIIDKHWGPSCQASDPWRQKRPSCVGTPCFLGLVEAVDPFQTCFIVAGGLVVHASTSPTKRLACDTDITGDVQWRTCHSFCNFNLSVWQGAKPRTPRHFLCHFTKQLLDQWLSHAAQGLSGVSFTDVIDLTRKTDRFDGPIRTPYAILSFKCVWNLLFVRACCV